MKTGAVKIVGKAPGGWEVILALLMAGDIFGELALTGEDELRDHRAEAMDETLLCEVPRECPFGRGELSQSKAAEVAGTSRAEFHR